jgi:hypothetical protein
MLKGDWIDLGFYPDKLGKLWPLYGCEEIEVVERPVYAPGSACACCGAVDVSCIACVGHDCEACRDDMCECCYPE